MGTILTRLRRLAHDYLRAAETAEQCSLASELMDFVDGISADALASEINSQIRRALEIAGQLNPYAGEEESRVGQRGGEAA